MEFPGRFRILIGLVRPYTLLAPLAVTPLVAWAAVGTGVIPRWHELGFVTATLVLVNVSANFWNASADAALDRVGRPDRPVATGLVKEAEARWIGYALALVALARAFTITWAFGILVAAAIAASWAYSFRIRSHRVASWAMLGLTRGGLGPWAAWSAFAFPLDARILAFALVGAMYATALWAVKDVGDADQDRMTWVIVLWIVFVGLASVFLASLLMGPPVTAAATAGVLITGGLAVGTGKTWRGHPAAWYGAYVSLVLLAAAFAVG